MKRTVREIYRDHMQGVNAAKRALSSLGEVFKREGQAREANYYFRLAADIEWHQNR